MIHPITTALVVDLYASQVRAGVLREYGALDGAVGAPFVEFSGYSPYPTLAQKAGKLLDGIQRVQAFSDGNKRIAWLATDVFLYHNGQVLKETDPNHINEFVRGLAGCKDGEVRATEWLSQRMRHYHEYP